MKYHFRVHHGESGKFWGECVEMPGCVTQAGTEVELQKNMEEVLNLYLDEPVDSGIVFPPPKKMKISSNIVEVQVMPEIALATRIRNARLLHGYTQMLPAGHSLYEMGGLAFSGAQTLAVGTVATNSSKYACLWDASGAHVLSRPAGHEGYAGGIVVVAGVARVVGWTEASALAEPCVWVNGGRNALPLPAGAESGFSQTISMDGGQELVGGCVKISGTWVPCLWKDRVPSLISFNTNLYEFVEYSRAYAVAVR